MSTSQLADDFKDHFSITTCTPHFVGVWDTVSSVGWIENPLRLPYTADNPRTSRSAATRLRSTRSAPSSAPICGIRSPDGGPADLKQVWFPGVHCDVGGGYPEADSGLSKLALEWMLDEAKDAQLLVDPRAKPSCSDKPAAATSHPSAGQDAQLLPASGGWPSSFRSDITMPSERKRSAA